MRKNWAKIAISILIIFGSLVSAYFIDLYFFQILPQKDNHATLEDVETSYQGIAISDDGTITTTNGPVSIFYKFPSSYVHKLVISTWTTDGKRISYIVECDGVLKNPNNTLNDFNDAFQTETEVINVNAVVNQIEVKFLSIPPGTVFRFDLVDLDYSVRSNPLIILSIFLILVIGFYTLALWIGFFKFKFEQVGAIYTVVFGLLLAFLIPPSSSYDEFAHMVKNFRTSIFDIHTEVENPLELPESFENLDRTDYRSYEDYLGEINKLEPVQLDSYKRQEVKPSSLSAFSYSFIPYIFSSIGLKIAELFKVNLFYWTFFSRAGNVLFFAFMFYWALKIFPSNKPFLFYFALLPSIFYAEISVGTTPVMMACLLLGFSYLAYLITEKEKVTWKDYLLLLLLFFVITNCRMPNGLFTLSLLLIPNKKLESEFLKKYNKIITIVLTFVFMLSIYIYTSSVGLTILSVPGANSTEQMKYILSNIFGFIQLILKYSVGEVLRSGVFIDFGFILNSGYLVPIVSFFSAVLFIYLALAGNKNKLTYDTVPSRIILWGTFLFTVALSEAVLYITFNPVGAGSISGFQPRYILTVLFIPFLTFESKNFYIVSNTKILNNVTVSYIFLIFVLMIRLVLGKFYF